MPVAMRAAPVGALVAAGADRLDGFGIDPRLQPGADQFGEHRPGISRLQSGELGKQGRMVLSHRVVCPFRESLGR